MNELSKQTRKEVVKCIWCDDLSVGVSGMRASDKCAGTHMCLGVSCHWEMCSLGWNQSPGRKLYSCIHQAESGRRKRWHTHLPDGGGIWRKFREGTIYKIGGSFKRDQQGSWSSLDLTTAESHCRLWRWRGKVGEQLLGREVVGEG